MVHHRLDNQVKFLVVSAYDLLFCDRIRFAKLAGSVTVFPTILVQNTNAYLKQLTRIGIPPLVRIRTAASDVEAKEARHEAAQIVTGTRSNIISGEGQHTA